MAHIQLGDDFNKMECPCCGDIYHTGGEPCICRVTSPWYQNQHGEAACAIHHLEKFSYKSLADIKRERELALLSPSLAQVNASTEAKRLTRYG